MRNEQNNGKGTTMMTTEEATQNAETILEQMGGKGRIGAMVGVTSFFMNVDKNKGGAGFRFRARAAKAIKCVTIVLEASDTYTMKFYSLRGVVKHEVTDVYATDLKSIFEDTTGLYLSL